MKHQLFKRRAPEKDMPDADRTLQKVFEACSMKPNTLPIEELIQHSRENTVRFAVCMWISIVMLTITFFMPLIFKPLTSHHVENDITVSSSEMRDGKFVLHLSGFMIDYTSIYAIDEDGEKIQPISFNGKTGEVDFHYNNESWNIYISDLNGSQLHLLLTPKG